MSSSEEPLEVLQEIRTLMERSGRFLSLSGLAGVYVGLYALAGVAGLHLWYGVSPFGTGLSGWLAKGEGVDPGFVGVFLGVGVGVLAASLATGLWMAVRKASARRESLWDAAARQLLLNLMIPLVAGGLYVLALLYHGFLMMVVPATMIFYGLGLVNAARYTLGEARGLGIAFILVGLAATLQPMYAHWYWAFSFGFLHIVYGLWIHGRYER